MGHLGEANLDLDLPNGVFALLWVDLALQGFKNERFVAMRVGELVAPQSRQSPVNPRFTERTQTESSLPS